MEQYRIITIDITQIDEEQEEALNDIPGVISKRSTIMQPQSVKQAEELDQAIIGVKNDILEYERDVEDIKLDHVKGDME